MTDRDFNAWLAVRSIGEAVTRAQSSDPQTLHDYLVGDQFEIAAFKGEPLTFRRWNQQMRAPIILVTSRVLVSVSPQDQFLHQRTPREPVPSQPMTAFAKTAFKPSRRRIHALPAGGHGLGDGARKSACRARDLRLEREG